MSNLKRIYGSSPEIVRYAGDWFVTQVFGEDTGWNICGDEYPTKAQAEDQAKHLKTVWPNATVRIVHIKETREETVCA